MCVCGVWVCGCVGVRVCASSPQSYRATSHGPGRHLPSLGHPREGGPGSLVEPRRGGGDVPRREGSLEVVREKLSSQFVVATVAAAASVCLVAQVLLE